MKLYQLENRSFLHAFTLKLMKSQNNLQFDLKLLIDIVTVQNCMDMHNFLADPQETNIFGTLNIKCIASLPKNKRLEISTLAKAKKKEFSTK